MNEEALDVLNSLHTRLCYLEAAERRFFITGIARPELNNNYRLAMLCRFRFILRNDARLNEYRSRWRIRIYMIGEEIEKRFLDVCKIFRNNDICHFHIDYDLQSLKYSVKFVGDPEKQDFLSSDYKKIFEKIRDEEW